MNSKINGLGTKEVDEVSLGPFQKITYRPNGHRLSGLIYLNQSM